MLEQLKTRPTDNLEAIFEKAQLIYTTCFEEVVRQVSVHCFERGRLIKMIWEAYLGLLEHALACSKT
jgi:hypothetical protein